MSDGTSHNNKNSFPVSLAHVFSYQLAPGNLNWAKESVLQADMTKVLRYSHKLPEKEASFIKVTNCHSIFIINICVLQTTSYNDTRLLESFY